MTKPTDEQTELSDLADKLIAALGDDTAALKDDHDPGCAKPVVARLTVYQKGEEKPEQAAATAVLRPATQAAMSTFYLTHYGKALASENLTVDALVEELEGRIKAVKEKDVGRGVAMLTAQAHTLDAVSNTLLRKAFAGSMPLELFEAYMKYALRAQSQSRATWEAVSAIQNPPIAGYVGQANIAQGGPQQVNNETSTRARPRRKRKTPNELLEHKQHEPNQRFDPRASDAAISGDSQLAPVGAINRPEDSSR